MILDLKMGREAFASPNSYVCFFLSKKPIFIGQIDMFVRLLLLYSYGRRNKLHSFSDYRRAYNP